MEFEKVDIAVIGAGISGIAAAKFYLDVHPHCALVILEKDRSVGGVWNSERVYDTFYTQSPLGIWEYSDMPMQEPPKEDMYEASFKAKYTSQYLETYIDRCVHAGKSLRERIEYSFDVQKITKDDGGWTISGQDKTGETRLLKSPKLIVASGLTSVPNMPILPGQEWFGNPIIHQKDFGKSDVLSSSTLKHVTVLGAAKSAADLVYDCVEAGKAVKWIVRRAGTGPGVFVSSPSRKSASAAYSIGTLRIVPTLTPSLFNADSWWNRLVHRSWIGRRLLTDTWKKLDKDVIAGGRFDSRGEEAKKNGFHRLKPHTPFIWQNQGAGVINRPDFWDTVAKNVQVYHEDIETLDTGVIRLKDGQEIPADAILCGTGWIPSLGFFDHDQLAKLGLPQPIGSYPSEQAKMWKLLEEEADQTVLDRFPILAKPPDHYREPVRITPYRLYNNIAPLLDRSVAIVGHVLIANYFHLSECQAIWATAYLDGKVNMQPLEERKKEVALFVAWCRRRYLSNGDRGHWMASEQRTYTDRLMDQLGLSSHRRFWLWDSFAPISKGDLPRLRAEYIEKYGQDIAGANHGKALANLSRGLGGRLEAWKWRQMAKANPLPGSPQARGSTRTVYTSATSPHRSKIGPFLKRTRLPKYMATFSRSARLLTNLAR